MILFGASGHGKVIADILDAGGITDIEFWDDAPDENFKDYKVSKTPADLQGIKGEIIISIGINATRKRVAERLNNSLPYGNAIHPGAIISRKTIIGPGTVIMAGTVINTDSKIGAHCIINTNASVDHDCNIGDYVHVSPNAALCGDVTVGEGTHVGAGSVVIPGIKIGRWCAIGAGAVVIRDVPDFATVVGNPGKIIKYKTA